jgi:hypothetical protein
MSKSADLPRLHVARGEKTVVLLLPELLGGVDEAQLRGTLSGAPQPVRALLCLPNQGGHELAASLKRIGVETEILLGPAVVAPATNAFTLSAPLGTLPAQQTEFALALSDVVLFVPGSEQNLWLRTAKLLGKPTIALGKPVVANPALAATDDRLDPHCRGFRRAFGRRMWGRLEQCVIELLAFNWRGKKERGVSWKRLRKCLGRSWAPGAYFGPSNWPELAPDRSALPSSEIVACFDVLDRSALYGAYIHRDLVWLEHLGAAFAVLFAVTGFLGHEHHVAWGVSELVTLGLVAAMVIWVRRTDLQDRWTAYRLGAEQLRIALMSMPLLVLPSALATADTPPAADSHGNKETQYGFMALALVKRVVRNHGLPRLDPALTPAKAAEWLRLIVEDQIAYHLGNHAKLERAERGLRSLTQAIFLIAVVSVGAHFYWPDAHAILLATAAAPALAAALHGTGTRLGIVHRAALSVEVERELEQIDDKLEEIAKMPPDGDAWSHVRHLAFEAAEAMGRENSSWHGLVRRYRDDLP